MALRKEWGEDYAENLGAAKEALRVLDENGKVAEFLRRTGLGNSAEVVRFFHRISEKLGVQVPKEVIEEVENQGRAAEVRSAKTPAASRKTQAKLDIAKLRATPQYSDPRHPDHKKAVQLMTRLYQAAYGDE